MGSVMLGEQQGDCQAAIPLQAPEAPKVSWSRPHLFASAAAGAGDGPVFIVVAKGLEEQVRQDSK